MFKCNLHGHLVQLHGGRVGQAEHDHVDAVGVADEVVVGEVVPLAPRELPDAAVAHRAEAELLHADGTRALVLARPRPARHRGDLAWYSAVK